MTKLTVGQITQLTHTTRMATDTLAEIGSEINGNSVKRLKSASTTCLWCGEPLLMSSVRNHKQGKRYCSDICRTRAWMAKRHPTCPHCGKKPNKE